MERFCGYLYDFMYGGVTGRKILKRRRKGKIAASLSTVFLIPLTAAAGLGWFRGFLLALLTSVCLWIIPELLLYQKVKEVKLSVRLDLPDFLDVIALLLEAGQPLWHAVETAGHMEDSELCRRLANAFRSGGSMEGGRNPELLLEQLAVELKMPEVTSAAAAIVQNSRKGEGALADVLRAQSRICRQQRKELAEELGNRASNLMLLPSGMVFIAILLMLMAPAIMQLSIF